MLMLMLMRAYDARSVGERGLGCVGGRLGIGRVGPEVPRTRKRKRWMRRVRVERWSAS